MFTGAYVSKYGYSWLSIYRLGDQAIAGRAGAAHTGRQAQCHGGISD